MADCGPSLDAACRDKTVALQLKGAAIAVILIASSLGVLIPIFGRRLSFLRTDGNLFFISKAFAAGVILATGFVHMLPDAQNSLGSSCLPMHPWGKFPWAGFIPMVAALGTLVVDFAATEYYETRHLKEEADKHGASSSADAGTGTYKPSEFRPASGLMKGDGENQEIGDGRVHIVGMHAHAAGHTHSHPEGHHDTHPDVESHIGHHHGGQSASDEGSAHIRHVVIAQVLEFGILAHSVIIGITLGVSQSPCVIRPLLAALTFHQFFEGFALGGCISQARFKYGPAAIMAFFFATTTPLGIGIGLGIATSYNENSPKALIIEGIFDAISAGILIYMALVDLIAADFLSRRMRCDRQLQVFSYLALFAGSGAMSVIAIWA